MRLTEMVQIAAGFMPVDLQTATSTLREGDWVSMRLFQQLAIVLLKDGGAAGDDITLTVQQATSAAGANAKALPFTTIYRKQGADLQSIGQWTITTQAAANTYTNDTSAEQECLWIVEFDADDLDGANGFHFVRAIVNDVGSNAQLGCLLYILSGPRYPDAVNQMASALS